MSSTTTARETSRLLQHEAISASYSNGDGDGELSPLEGLEQQATEESVEVVDGANGEVPRIVSSPSSENPTDEEVPNAATNNTRDEGHVAQMTRRLRCLFTAVTWPIVPLGTILTFALLWVLYAAFALDVRRDCSHPLHWYAICSLCFVAYAPHHSQIRGHLFRYSRERDGPIRPIPVRMYDQLFHTLCILYVYGGITLMETCREDTGTNNNTVEAGTPDQVYEKEQDGVVLVPASPASTNTCAATCPNLYQAMSVYITTLELFSFALILPLLFLPCVYLWIIRRASAEAEAFSQFRERLEEEEALLQNNGWTAQEILESLEKVKLVSVNDDQLKLLPLSASSIDLDTGGPRNESMEHAEVESLTRECCICMSDFEIHRVQHDDVEVGIASSHTQDEDFVVRTKCGHVFHATCLAGWIGGRWEPNQVRGGSSSSLPRRRARRTCCPLCRQDLKPSRRVEDSA